MRSESNNHGGRRTRGAAGAFSIIELLVVVGIIILLVAIAIPAFSSILYSQDRSLAANKLEIALGAGRDAAIRSETGRDGAIVFFFEPGDRVRMVPCQAVGELNDSSEGAPTIREVFAPVSTIETIELPRGWSIAAYVPPGAVDGTWYEDTYAMAAGAGTSGYWVQPETGYYDAEEANDGADRQTFMVRFEYGTGIARTMASGDAIVVDPRPSSTKRSRQSWARPDQAENLVDWSRRILSRPDLDDEDRAALLGSRSGDTVLARSVSELALFDASRLAAALGVTLDRRTNSIYRAGTDGPVDPAFVTDFDAQDANRWFAGDTNLNDVGPDDDEEDRPQARVYTIDRYLGSAREIPVGASNGAP